MILKEGQLIHFHHRVSGRIFPGRVINEDPNFQYLRGYISINYGFYMDDKLYLPSSQKMRIRSEDLVPTGDLTEVLYL